MALYRCLRLDTYRLTAGASPLAAAERWQSGRMHRTRNAAYGQPYRGFESLPLRHQAKSMTYIDYWRHWRQPLATLMCRCAGSAVWVHRESDDDEKGRRASVEASRPCRFRQPEGSRERTQKTCRAAQKYKLSWNDLPAL